MIDEIFLDNILEDMEKGDLIDRQSLFLIFKAFGRDLPIKDKDLFSLVETGYIKNNKNSNKITAFRKEIGDITGTIKPIYHSEFSREVVKKLCRLFCVTDNKGNLSMPGGATPEELIKYTADKYLKKEQLVAYYYLVLLFLFPVAGSSNKRWEKHFTKKEYDGPRLRIRAIIHGKLLLKIVKKHDIGIFLYGAYLYMHSATKGDRPYITTVTKFMYDYEDWYFDAKEKFKEAKTVEDLFKKHIRKHDDFNLIIDD
jgi:hypothetical protein